MRKREREMERKVEANPTRIQLSDERREVLLAGLKKLHHSEFDRDLSDFQAEQILRYFTKALGPSIYNQAIADARGFMIEKLEDLDVEFFESGGIE